MLNQDLTVIMQNLIRLFAIQKNPVGWMYVNKISIF